MGGVHGGFPKLGGYLLGVPVIRVIVFWGLFWGSPYCGKLPHRDIQAVCEPRCKKGLGLQVVKIVVASYGPKA